jgi:hypothetical protein
LRTTKCRNQVAHSSATAQRSLSLSLQQLDRPQLRMHGSLEAGENQSRRDPTKVAQHPPRRTGLAFLKGLSVPHGTIDQCSAIAESRATPKAECFVRPSRTDASFLHHFPALRAGLLSLSSFLSSPLHSSSQKSLQGYGGQVLTIRSQPLQLTRIGSGRVPPNLLALKTVNGLHGAPERKKPKSTVTNTLAAPSRRVYCVASARYAAARRLTG